MNQHVGPSPLAMGATLYVPATHPALAEIVSGERVAGLRSLIICLEDAVLNHEVPQALGNVERALVRIGKHSPWCFIRPRTPAMLSDLLGVPGISAVTGFALAKATIDEVDHAITLLRERPAFQVMPILETEQIFDARHMRRMARFLTRPEIRPFILMARIGGNDLLRCLGLRRDLTQTIYESPVGHVIAQLVTTFLPQGISLSGPVFDGLGDFGVLRAEIQRDLAYGLFTKTAAHPAQVAMIQASYRPSQAEIEMAEALLAPNAPAVFRLHDRMCESTVHTAWAKQIIQRWRLFGSITPS
jgi:citrate lyase beta subunit